MNTGVHSLSEREKETLRLLRECHDAKSIARSLGLSVHTVNERLRDARRKLSVSSSREAARLLAEAEQHDPKLFGDKQLGVAEDRDVRSDRVLDQQRVPRTLWLGGTFVMSLIIAAVLLSSGLGGNSDAVATAGVDTVAASESPAAKAARAWVAIVDDRKWEQSWQAAAAMFKSQVTAAGWAAAVEPVRTPLGAVLKRQFHNATKHDSLPGAPAGDYEIVEFKTSFAKAKDMTETVVLSKEDGSWKVVGYFIRP